MNVDADVAAFEQRMGFVPLFLVLRAKVEELLKINMKDKMRPRAFL